MVQIGNRYKERMPSFVGNGHCFFDYTYIVKRFRHEPYGDFAVCERLYKDGKKDRVDIDIELLENEKTCYEKIA